MVGRQRSAQGMAGVPVLRQEKYGYDVSDLAFAEAPFGELFQKIAPTLASGSNEFNLMIVDSQWLGALSEPGWIVKADEVFALNPELDIEPYSSLVTNTYQVYPDGSDSVGASRRCPTPRASSCVRTGWRIRKPGGVQGRYWQGSADHLRVREHPHGRLPGDC